MSIQKLDMIVIGWKCPYEDEKKYDKSINVEDEFDSKSFYKIFVDKNRFSYYDISENDMNKAYCFFDGCNGGFIIWGVPLAAQCDQGDIYGFEPKAWTKEELKEKKRLAKEFRDTIPECIRPEGKPQLIIFTQYH